MYKKRLYLTTVSSLVIFFVASALSYFIRSDFFGMPGCNDCIRRVGFPWVIWEEGGVSHREIFSFSALLLDLALSAGVGVVTSLLLTSTSQSVRHH